MSEKCPSGSGVGLLGAPLVVPFEKAVRPSGGGALLEEVDHCGKLRPTSFTLCFLAMGAM